MQRFVSLITLLFALGFMTPLSAQCESGIFAPLLTQVGCPGEAALFSLLEIDDPTITYQWQRRPAVGGIFEEIEGANSSTLLIDPIVAEDIGRYRVVVSDLCGVHTSPSVRLECHLFIRGDSNNDGTVDTLTDGIYLLQFAFTAGAAPPCFAATDVDGNGNVNGILDGLYLLTWGFASGPPIPSPFPECGTSPTSEFVGCVTSPCI